MKYANQDDFFKEFRADCGKCFGLCCTALYFSASDGFPTNKDAGKPCINLQPDFTCTVHKNLREKGLRGCTAYDCFGAGQKVAQLTFGGKSWRQAPETSEKMFGTFLIMKQLHEMLWYLKQAFMLNKNDAVKEEIRIMIENTESIALYEAEDLLRLDIEVHRNKVNILLKNTSDLIRTKASRGKKAESKKLSASSSRFDFFGADLRKINLISADLRGACLIAANLSGVNLSGADFIGADMRDADIRGADLSNSIFLTQAQINTAKGNSHTKLPEMLVNPEYWTK